MTWSNNKQVEAYLKPRQLKEHEKELLQMIQADHPEFRGRVLDIGCGSGHFLGAMSRFYPEADYVGIDLSDEMLQIAREQLAQVRAQLLKKDAAAYQPEAPFDIEIASGILSIFEEFEPVLDEWISWLKPGGRLYIFGRFNSAPVDTLIRFRNHAVGNGEWESGLTAYSIQTVEKFLQSRGVQYSFKRFRLNLDLPKKGNPIQTYTVKLEDGSRMVLNGANIVAEHYFLSIQK